MEKNPVADLVGKKRRSLRLTQAELAIKAGVGLRFIRDLEQGKPSLRTDTVNKVLFLFGKRLGAVDLPNEDHLAGYE
ncbi:MAG: helix-turn-helix transcriptional regulator [Elusimicrobia bacterium]|nr:helix-turn-helix transcriptional regulator [Elusimicrobiota bacterium]